MEEKSYISKEKSKERITGLDAFRVMSCAFVIILHCNSKVLIQLEAYSAAWYVSLAVFYVTKIAVPGFLMISGYNLLHRQDSWQTALKRACRIFLVLIVGSLLYFTWRYGISTDFDGQFALISGASGEYRAGYAASAIIKLLYDFFTKFVAAFWSDSITDAFWYLYMYLGLMLTMPFLQKLAGNMERRDYHVFFFMSLIFTGIIPAVAEFIPALALPESFALPLIQSYWGCVVYLLIGNYFYLYGFPEFLEGSGGKWIPIFGFLTGVTLNILLSAMEYRITAGESLLGMSEITYFPLMLESVTAFILVLKINYKSEISKLIGLVAPQTFGIYLISDFICAQTHYIYYYLCPYMNRLAAVAIQDIVALTAAFGVMWLIRRVSWVRKYI